MSGIFGAYSMGGGNVVEEVIKGVMGIQQRGEAGCGISFDYRKGFLSESREGMAYDFFKKRLEKLESIDSRVGIGHLLYEDKGGLQPVECEGEGKHILSLAMDGVLLGFEQSNDFLMKTMFSDYLAETGDIYKAVGKVMDNLSGKGSYCVVSIVKMRDEVNLIAFRDPQGIKPYSLGRKIEENDEKYIVSSETQGLDAVEADFMRDIEPGEVLIVSEGGLESKILRSERHAHCFFEWIYFASPNSNIGGRNVYLVRKELGRKLARRYTERLSELDLIMPSPDSGRSVAIGCQQELCSLLNKFLPYEEAAIKIPGARRTFQIEELWERLFASENKFYINREVVKGRNIGIGDDSIVKGTVFRKGMIEKTRNAGAKIIIPIISCPALCHSCIKDPLGKEFAAYGLEGDLNQIGEEVAKKINADFVCYPSVEDMIDSVGDKDLCKACVDGNFPVDEEFLR